MWVDIESKINVLNKKIEVILNNMTDISYEKTKSDAEIPLLSHLEEEDYINLKNIIFKLRSEIIHLFIKSNSNLRIAISNSLKKYEYFGLVFVPNKYVLNNISNKEEYLLSILITISIQNLNDDIRDLIIYVNSLNDISKKEGIVFNELLKKIIPISSNLAETYTVSMKEFFEYYLNEKSIPVEPASTRL